MEEIEEDDHWSVSRSHLGKARSSERGLEDWHSQTDSITGDKGRDGTGTSGEES